MSAGGAEDLCVSIDVSVAPAVAFRVFTEQVDRWWKHGPRYRMVSLPLLRFEPGVGGRLLATDPDGARLHELGRISVWRPGERLVFGWRLPGFAAGQDTEVEVRFEPVSGGTRIVLEHRGWETLPAAHPVRHGFTGREFVLYRGAWWAALLESLTRHIATRPIDRRTDHGE